jgi:hypothetical protein
VAARCLARRAARRHGAIFCMCFYLFFLKARNTGTLARPPFLIATARRSFRNPTPASPPHGLKTAAGGTAPPRLCRRSTPPVLMPVLQLLRPHCRMRLRPRLRQRRRLRPTRRSGSSRWPSPSSLPASSARRDAELTIQATLPARRATSRRRRRQPRLTTQTPFFHLTLPPPFAGLKQPHQRPNLHPDTKQQRTDQSQAHPQVHDDRPDITAATETDVAAAATVQPREELQPPPLQAHRPAIASDSETVGDRTGATADVQTTSC